MTAPTIDAIVAAALADALGDARRAHADGLRVIGYVGGDVPIELITAAGAFPVMLPGYAGRDSGSADRYLESSFAPLERSIAQQWLDGEFDFIESVVLSRARDSSQRLYYYLCELQRRGLCAGPRPLLFDIAKIGRDTSARHTLASVERLAAGLGTDRSRLAACIALRDRRRRLLAELQAVRLSETPPDGSTAQRIDQAADLCDADAFDGALEAWLRHDAAGPRGRPRLVLAGSAPPDARLHVAVETAGAVIVAEFGDHALTRLGVPVASSGDPTAALADHYHRLACGPRAFIDRARLLLTLARTARADGVVIWLIEEEEALIWDLPAQRQMLGASAIAQLVLTRSRWDATEETGNSIHAFAASLRRSA